MKTDSVYHTCAMCGKVIDSVSEVSVKTKRKTVNYYHYKCIYEGSYQCRKLKSKMNMI